MLIINPVITSETFKLQTSLSARFADTNTMFVSNDFLSPCFAVKETFNKYYSSAIQVCRLEDLVYCCLRGVMRMLYGHCVVRSYQHIPRLLPSIIQSRLSSSPSQPRFLSSQQSKL